MKLILFSHPRSRSTDVLAHLPNPYNENLELKYVNPRTLEFTLGEFQGEENRMMIYNNIGEAYLAKFVGSLPDSYTVKVFASHIFGLGLFEDWVFNPNHVIIGLERINSTAAVMSMMLAKRRGFWKSQEREIQPEYLTHGEAQICVNEILAYRHYRNNNIHNLIYTEGVGSDSFVTYLKKHYGYRDEPDPELAKLTGLQDTLKYKDKILNYTEIWNWVEDQLKVVEELQ